MKRKVIICIEAEDGKNEVSVHAEVEPKMDGDLPNNAAVSVGAQAMFFIKHAVLGEP